MAITRRTLEQKDFIDAATAFLADHPLSDLTMRVLGNLLGVDATACYRHFRSKGELLTAMVDAMLGSVVDAVPDDLTDPRLRLETQCIAMRAVMSAHPQLAAALAVGEGRMPNALVLSRRLVEQLRAIGGDGDDLVRAYQAIESYTMGSTIFDLAAAPQNMEIRAARYGAFEDPAFAAIGRSVGSVGRISDDAFASGLRALLDRIEAGTF